MSHRLRRKTRPQGDVEIFGGPLKQKQFDGGMNIDDPASEIKANEVAYATNVIFREHGFEPRTGTIEISEFGFTGIDPTKLYDYTSNKIKFGVFSVNYNHIVSHNSAIRFYGENPRSDSFVYSFGYKYSTGVDSDPWNPGTGDTTTIPYRRGVVVFNSSKISYCEAGGAFQINAPNPVHGISNDNASGAFKYRYLLTLSRSSVYGSDGLLTTAVATDRYASGAELVHESGTNGARYNNSGTSTARQTDFGEVFKDAAISSGSAYSITNSDLKAAFSSTSSVTDNSAALHFTHITIWRTLDFGAAGTALGNSNVVYYWVADVKRSDVFGGSGFSDTFTDDAILNKGLILKTQGFTPIPSGSCGEIAGGWLFVSDRTNATSENFLNYCALSNSIENIGYHFHDVQKWRFNQGIRAMRANQDTLSIFCESSSHICNMTSYVASASTTQSVPFLNYFHAVDRAVGIKDWATLDSIDENTMIAVCSDGTIRKWDTTRWGDDLAYNKVSSEIRQIVPASPFTYERGSVGKYYKGAYYLWYSKDSSDTATTHCLRYGMGVSDTQYAKGTGKQAGFGWSFYTNYPQPNFKRGVSIVDDSQGVQRMVVIRASNGRFYWCETFTPFAGAIDNTNITGTPDYPMVQVELDLDDYPNHSGTEITSSVYFRELAGASEVDVLLHEETFHSLRPKSPTVGYRSGTAISTLVFLNGSTTAAETLTGKPIFESVKFVADIYDRRVQLGVSINRSGWKYVGIESHFRSLDKVDFLTAGDTPTSAIPLSYTRAQEDQYQEELATNLIHWVTRRDAFTDAADGVALTQVGTVSNITGPDQKTDSALLFQAGYQAVHRASTHIFSDIVGEDVEGFTLSFWVKSPTYGKNFIYLDGSTRMSIKITDNTHIQLNGDPAYDTMTALGTGWNFFVFRRYTDTMFNNVKVYLNKTLFVATDNTEVPFGGSQLWIGNFSGDDGLFDGQVFDVRIYNKLVSVEAMEYYYDVVINNQSDLVLPQV